MKRMRVKKSIVYKILGVLLVFFLGTSHASALNLQGFLDFAESDPDKINTQFDSTFSTAWDLYLNTWNTEVLNPYMYDFYSFNHPVNICLSPDSLGFVMPVANIVTSDFGPRHGRPHQGVDLDLETGDTVVSAFDGVVRMSKTYYGYGNMVVVRHFNGLETLYGHLSKVLVEPGQTVKAGEVVGLGGNTGHSFGSHLHFEIRFMGQPIDPSKFISFDQFSLLNNEVLIDSSTFNNGKLIHKTRKEVTLEHEAHQAVVKPAPKKVHVVKSGDTLSAIARRNKTTVANLCKLNHIKAEGVLALGLKIKLK
jgi:murein DD-endopeptidase MepM/ murein hydrolase activator NlpD